MAVWCVCSVVWLFGIPWPVACRAPPSMEFSGLPFPTPGDCPDSKIEPTSPVSPALAGRFFTTMPWCSIIGKAVLKVAHTKIIRVAKSSCCDVLLFTLLSRSFSTSKVVKTKDHFLIFFLEPHITAFNSFINHSHMIMCPQMACILDSAYNSFTKLD